MFVKLMRKEGQPIWIKAESVVTVEGSLTGGSIVVPMGDGLDYEVIEEPEVVLALLAGEKPPAPKKAKRATTKKAKEKEEAEESKPKKTTRKRTTKKKEPEVPPVFFPVEQLERVRKMAPGSVRKLANTLNKQFNVSDPDALIKHLEATGVIAVVEHGHVNWLPPSPNNILIP